MLYKQTRHGLALGRYRLHNSETPPSTGSTPASSAGTENTGSNAETPKTVPYERFAEVNSQMRAFEAELKKLRDEQAKRDEAERLKRGEHEAVINELKPKAVRAETLEKTLTDYLNAELESVPEEMQFLFADGDVAERLTKIKAAKAKGIIGKPTPPQTDAGITGNTVKPANLTPEELRTAAKLGMTPEEYAKYKV